MKKQLYAYSFIAQKMNATYIHNSLGAFTALSEKEKINGELA